LIIVALIPFDYVARRSNRLPKESRGGVPGRIAIRSFPGSNYLECNCKAAFSAIGFVDNNVTSNIVAHCCVVLAAVPLRFVLRRNQLLRIFVIGRTGSAAARVYTSY
jgi:hypothetical protein